MTDFFEVLEGMVETELTITRCGTFWRLSTPELSVEAESLEECFEELLKERNA